MSSKTRLRKIPSDFEKTFIPNSSAVLARSHRLIRIEQEKEILFMCLCSHIHLDNFRKNRSEKQREERRQKRKNTFDLNMQLILPSA
jgi:hypothetical protein